MASEDDKEVKEGEAVDETTSTSAETLEKVAERLKFFFSDANLRGDRFLQKEIDMRHGSGKRPVPIEVLLRFNTLKQYTTDAAVVVQAAQKHLSDRLLVVEKSDQGPSPALQRVQPFTVEMLNDNIPKSLVVSNLPIAIITKEDGNDDDEEQEAKYAVTMDDIRNIFEAYGEVAMIRMRFGPSPKQQKQQEEEEKADGGHDRHSHHQKVKFSYPAQYAFVEYETIDGYEKACAEILTSKQGTDLEPKRKLELCGNELKVISLKDYMDEQRTKRQAKQEAKKQEQEEKNRYTVDWKPGCVIKLEGLADGCDREAIMDAVAAGMDSTVERIKEEQLVYVDFSRGQTTGAIRFFSPSDKIQILLAKLCPSAAATAEKPANGDEADNKADKKKDGGDDETKKDGDGDGDTVIQIAGAKVEKAYLLEGEAEEKYWKDFIDFKNQKRRLDDRKYNNKSNKRQKRRYND